MEYTFVIEPKTYTTFEDEAAQLEKCKEWGLLSEKASKTKTFFYKGNGMNLPCSIIGYVDNITAVIEFDNRQHHCIHPSYLKEMQASNYGLKPAVTEDATAAPEPEIDGPSPSAEQSGKEEPAASEPAKEKAKKGKTQKLQLPEEKVKMTATVKQFVTVPNHFSDTDDEVVIYDPVTIAEPETAVGTAWSSLSATLKKLELAVGDTIAFEGKIVAKKLAKHPVPYKINNPAKIQKI